MLTFEPVAHEYQWHGKPVPGITRLMEPIHSYDGVPDWVLERKADLGKAVHLACELFDADDLVEESLDERTAGYFEGWKKFRRERGGAVLVSESQMYHPTMGYAGTPDRAMEVDTPCDVVEIKTTATLFDAVGIQVAAQKELMIANGKCNRNSKRFAVQLKPNGTYTMREFKDSSDYPVFVSLLTIHNWKTRHAGH